MSIHISGNEISQADTGNICSFPEPIAAQIVRLLDTVDRHVMTDVDHARAFISWTRTLLVNDRQEIAEDRKVGSGLAPWQMKRVEKYVLDNIESSILISDLARVAGLSTSYFSKAFKDSYCTPPHAYINSKRIELAKSLLVTNEMSIAEIALECGLSDQAHLTRIFCKATGTPPSRWRRSQRTNKAQG